MAAICFFPRSSMLSQKRGAENCAAERPNQRSRGVLRSQAGICSLLVGARQRLMAATSMYCPSEGPWCRLGACSRSEERRVGKEWRWRGAGYLENEYCEDDDAEGARRRDGRRR